MTIERGFVLHCCVAAVMWAYKYVLYRVDVGQFPDGAKAALAAMITNAADGSQVRVVYKDTIGNHHWGLVTVMSNNKVGVCY